MTTHQPIRVGLPLQDYQKLQSNQLTQQNIRVGKRDLRGVYWISFLIILLLILKHQHTNHFERRINQFEIDKTDRDSWKKFDERIKRLNSKVFIETLRTMFEMIFIARHGEGFHNIAESKYGTPMWDCYWSELNGDQNLTWGPDSRLSPKGQNQIKLARESWKREISRSIPLPSLFITSPLSRAIETLEITSVWNVSKNTVPEVREGWRENIGLHTCDLRRTREEIYKDFGFVEFENRFNETDELWTKDFQETSEQLDIRIRKSLETLFNDPNDQKHTYVSITCHSGVINSLLRVIGHRPFPTQTGGMIPLVIKGSVNPTPTRPPLPGPSATKPDCPIDSSSSN
ncbi:uncharacterized protein MELLADRAFT_116456 [Melampsora larici-populina 98AG31]|uniref:Phosphoglycerate mutase n=1 Tax=Melampsora larici-populina (strain 98AG31 / pathotype 3-4-7) TaxID=747676 RepID=F4RLH8_MELLP|nr:uncharacterized protein MELLADRAFT_116456 [Melampsora larici-populina 98AG31]EGG06750.1 hypothetical protein MELLADRAFT_116456 [Melampsora larici-populina 98AG31]